MKLTTATNLAIKTGNYIGNLFTCGLILKPLGDGKYQSVLPSGEIFDDYEPTEIDLTDDHWILLWDKMS